MSSPIRRSEVGALRHQREHQTARAIARAAMLMKLLTVFDHGWSIAITLLLAQQGGYSITIHDLDTGRENSLVVRRLSDSRRWGKPLLQVTLAIALAMAASALSTSNERGSST